MILTGRRSDSTVEGNWPTATTWQPTKPGPQPHNQIAGTLEDQLRRVQRPVTIDRPVTRRELKRALARLVRDAGGAVSILSERIDAIERAPRRRSRRGGN